MTDSCLQLPFTKWYCNSGRHSVKVSNSGKRELLQRRWNPYNVSSSYMFIFYSSSPNNHLLTPFYSPLVSSFTEPCSFFSDNVIPLDLVSVNRRLSVSKVTMVIQRRLPCNQFYFEIEQICLIWILELDSLQSIFWNSLVYFGNNLRFRWLPAQDLPCHS